MARPCGGGGGRPAPSDIPPPAGSGAAAPGHGTAAHPTAGRYRGPPRRAAGAVGDGPTFMTQSDMMLTVFPPGMRQPTKPQHALRMQVMRVRRALVRVGLPNTALHNRDGLVTACCCSRRMRVSLPWKLSGRGCVWL